MIFNRNRGQVYIEELLNCFDPLAFADHMKAEYETNIKGNPILVNAAASELSSLLKLDAKDFFFKAILSISEALNGVFHDRYSWATIKLYYGVYYLIRTSLCLEDIALIVAKGLLYIKAEENGVLVKMPKGGENHSTHKGAIKMYLKLRGSRDVISLTSPIHGESPYFYLMEARELINYREREFHEPECSNIWERIKFDKDASNLSRIIQKYLSDPQTLILEDYACLSIPLFKLKEVYNRMVNANLLSFNEDQTSLLFKLWNVNDTEIFNLDWLIDTSNSIYMDRATNL